MGDEPAPEVQGEEGIDTGKASNKMALESIDRLFCRVSTVIIRRDQLVCDFVEAEEGFEGFWALVITFLEDGGEAAFLE